MKPFAIWMIAGAICGSPIAALAQLQLFAAKELPGVFAGDARKVTVLCQNTGASAREADIHMRLMQLTSATSAPIEDSPWKKLRILPGQTVMETALLGFPAVRSETRFLIQWMENTNRIIGSMEVLVYPTNLLSELQPLVEKEDDALGVFDPQDQLKPLLSNAKVDFVDLGNTELEKFRGKLAIIGPFESKTQIDAGFVSRIKTIAEKGAAVVWIQPPSEDAPANSEGEKLQPSFYSVQENQTAAVIVQPEVVANLSENPQSQLNLIYFCKLALHPQPLTLPFLKTQP